MVCHKPASWRTNFSRSALPDTATSKNHILLVYGNRYNPAVGDFGIKYIGVDHIYHLCDALRKETYSIVEDHVGDLYCGINLKWNYNKKLGC